MTEPHTDVRQPHPALQRAASRAYKAAVGNFGSGGQTKLAAELSISPQQVSQIIRTGRVGYGSLRVICEFYKVDQDRLTEMFPEPPEPAVPLDASRQAAKVKNARGKRPSGRRRASIKQTPR